MHSRHLCAAAPATTVAALAASIDTQLRADFCACSAHPAAVIRVVTIKVNVDSATAHRQGHITVVCSIRAKVHGNHSLEASSRPDTQAVTTLLQCNCFARILMSDLLCCCSHNCCFSPLSPADMMMGPPPPPPETCCTSVLAQAMTHAGPSSAQLL